MPGELTPILVGLVASGSTLIGVWLTQRYQTQKTLIEARRWYADHYLGRKIDSINNLLNDLVDYHSAVLVGSKISTLQEFRQEIQTKLENYRKSLIIASLYLEENDRRIMREALAAFNQSYTAIWLSLPQSETGAVKGAYDTRTREVDSTRLDDAYNAALDCLQDQVYPRVFRKDELDKLTDKN